MKPDVDYDIESKHQSATWVGSSLPRAKKLSFQNLRVRTTLVNFLTLET